MSYRKTKDQYEDAPNSDPQRSVDDYDSNVIMLAPPALERSKSDLSLTSSELNRYSSIINRFHTNPDPVKFRSSAKNSSATKLTQRSKVTPSTNALSLPLRLSRETDLTLVTGRASSDSHPYDLSKSIAESAMDISLLTANANQLRLLITYNQGSQTYTACITFIIMSLVLQMLVAVTMIIVTLTKQNLQETTRQKLKIITSVGVAVITMINILVASLVVAEQTPTSASGAIKIMEMIPVSTSTVTPATISTTVSSLLGTEAGTSVDIFT
ncbi:uncharacterized protein LOC129780283 [Toxorhynchites rutilus septentrionalis]|uniref:uncharacterized protein LOC129780283 n=1 Tax=Toxorhynchites rutilus septentrionalis TaxID=329112 RepID=UPI00247A36D7|nr:uncharacterized protein LOC129780283 [Toxorhynchites rutilus septentrionalis]